MPLYEYQCPACNQKLEVIRRISEHDILPTAEEEQGIGACVKHQWQRRISGTSFKLIGGGWFNSPGGY